MRRLKRRTVVIAGVACGILLAWILSPILASHQTARVTLAITWNDPTTQESKDLYQKALVKEAKEYAGVSLRSNRPPKPNVFGGIGFNRHTGNRIELFITTDDRRLSQTAVRDTVAHMAEWSAESPSAPKVTVVPSVWDDLPDFPDFPLLLGGIVLGLVAGLLMSDRLPVA
jgi:hypothetical protein